MKHSPPPPANIKPLLRLLEKDEPKVLVVVGAGVSCGSTGAAHASWLGLLKHGVDHLVNTCVITPDRGCALRDSLAATFKHFELQRALQYAEHVEQSLKIPDSGAFANWLEEAFRDLRIKPGHHDTLDAIRELHQAGALLLTTNYDSLLSDATGLPPVTWEEHDDFLRVSGRRQDGVLHIHGHWKRPSSVVLGRDSYDRIVADESLQSMFKSLWMDRSWIYVGCGDGLDDANLGCLLEWGKKWDSTAPPPHYFLGQADKAAALDNRPDKPSNLVSVGYPDHSFLPDILRSLTPAARCFPFVPVDKNFSLFRSTGSAFSVPFPSHKEYVDGNVPKLRADMEVRQRLVEHGWASVLGLASVGKTTLALRMAMRHEQRNQPVFYLDIAEIASTVDLDNEENGAGAAMARLKRPSVLLILDNVHYQPELARRLWDQWHDHPRDSKLLLIGKQMQQSVVTAPAQDLVFFSQHATNPAIELLPEPDELHSIFRSVVNRVVARGGKALPSVPQQSLEQWHRNFRAALDAFCLAVLGRLEAFSQGNWELPPEAAVDWVREKWLYPLDTANLENALCLAVFSGRDLEISVDNEALPHPHKIDQLLTLGLIARVERGEFSQWTRFRLRDSGWGRLILAASTPLDTDKTLFETAARHPIMAAILSSRLRQKQMFDLNERLWGYLANISDSVTKSASNLPLIYFQSFVSAAASSRQPQVAGQSWDVIESEPDKLTERAWEPPLNNLASFLNTAKEHGRQPEPLWRSIEGNSQKFAERAWETPLNHVASFLNTAERHGRDTVPLWDALEAEPDKLTERAWMTPLNDVASFLNTAKRHGRDTGPLWDALENEPHKLAERARETPLGNLASFLNTARAQGRYPEPPWRVFEGDLRGFADRAYEVPLRFVTSFLKSAERHGRDLATFWDALEREQDRLAERARKTVPRDVALFLSLAERHGRNSLELWKTIEGGPCKFAELVWETSLRRVGSFLDVAKRHGRDPGILWETLEREPDKFAECAWRAPLGNVTSFLKTAERHGRDPGILWETLEREPGKFAECAWETPLGHVGWFLTTAKRHGRDPEPFWEALEREPDKLVERASETTPLNDVGMFLDTAKRHGRVPDRYEGLSKLLPTALELERESDKVAERGRKTFLDLAASSLYRAEQHGRDARPLWEALEAEPEKLAERVWETPLNQIVWLLNTAKGHGRDLEPFWEALEREPDKFAERAWETPLHLVASFLNTAKRHGRDARPLWEALEAEPDKLADRAWETPLHLVASFFDTAERHGRSAKAFWLIFEGDLNKFAERAWDTSLGHVASFLDMAERHGHDPGLFWEALEAEPGKLADRAWETPLHLVASFLNTAERHGRDPRPLWEALEAEPEKLAERARKTSPQHIAPFLKTAKQHGRECDYYNGLFQHQRARGDLA